MKTRLNLEPSRRTLILLAVGSGAAFLLCCTVMALGMSMLGKVSAEFEQKQAEVEDGKQIATRLQASEQTYFDSVKELHFLEKSTSTRAYIPTLLKQLEQLGRSVNLKVVAVKPVIEQQAPAPKPAPEAGAQGSSKDGDAPPPKRAPKPPYEEQQIDISVEGTYNNALSFLYRLTTFPKILTVNSVEMSRKPTSANEPSSAGRLEIKCNVTAFVLDPPKVKMAGAL